jgi:hypothetical protein
MFYENVSWDGHIKKEKIGRYTNCNHCIAVDLISKHWRIPERKILISGKLQSVEHL